MKSQLIPLLSIYLSSVKSTVAQDVPFSPCPLLGPRFPIADNLATSSIIQVGLDKMSKTLDEYVTKFNGTFGPISPNTSFSVALFSTEDTGSSRPYFYEYHYTAKVLDAGMNEVDGDSVYRVGDLTTLFTTYLFLVEAGEQHWEDPVSKWVPELVNPAEGVEKSFVADWDKVTLGDLAAHLGGIGRFAPSDRKVAALLQSFTNSTAQSPCQTGSALCSRAQFLAEFGKRSPVFEPGFTPMFSNAGYIILAFALECITGRSYDELLEQSILQPLNMSSTVYNQVPMLGNSVIPTNATLAGWSSPSPIEGPFNGLYSSIHDVSTALRSILSSSLLPQETTHRWLKPVSHTSNLRNSVGKPWEIYSLSSTPISPVIPVYQVRGNVGFYSSHIGLVPDYNVGFVILAADSEANPDLNAHADIISVAMIPALEKNAIAFASKTFAGTYVSASNTSIVIAPAKDSSPGLSLTSFRSADKDVRAIYAELNNIDPENLSFRLYPSDMGTEDKIAFRASFQDVTALADAGTPTCETWRYIDQFQVEGVALDEFIFEMKNGVAVSVEIPWLKTSLLRNGNA